jgi:hypothetical protein
MLLVVLANTCCFALSQKLQIEETEQSVLRKQQPFLQIKAFICATALRKYNVLK